jgi:hypothetical protein
MLKRGQTRLIVAIIILIVSFFVILLFYNRLHLGATTNSEICHNSILLKSKSAGITGDLTCRTDYVCISGGGNCNNMIISPGMTINVDATNKTQILQVLANQLASCWYTFGEGKLDYIGPAVKGVSVCGICSVISFDSEIQSIYSGTEAPQTDTGSSGYNDCVKVLGDGSPICTSILNGEGSWITQPNELTYGDLIDYMSNTNKDSSQTYLQYLYGVSSAQDLIKAFPITSTFYNTGVISTADQYSTITGESKNALSFWSKGDYILSVILKTADISKYMTAQCGGNFITQAS